MGKLTQIHPVPLEAIRACTKYAGIVLGSIRQTKYSPENGTAIYSCKIKAVFDSYDREVQPEVVVPFYIESMMRECVTSDIGIMSIRYDSQHKWSMVIKTWPPIQKPSQAAADETLSWLSAAEDVVIEADPDTDEDLQWMRDDPYVRAEDLDQIPY